MKFGSNLSQLSIPEWRNYNLDYNLLKRTIKKITDANETNLFSLNHLFIENFNYINMFIKMKFDELFTKLNYLQNLFEQISIDPDNYLYKLDVINYQIYQISLEINKLSKFIVIQKIATRKIFKKFNKYYFDQQESAKFIINLKNYLLTDENSFINIDLFQLTTMITNLINNISHARKQFNLNNQSTNSVSSHRSSTSLFPKSFGTLDLSMMKKQELHPQQSPPTYDCSFDLSILLKKNFHLHFLSPPDMINDLMLYLNMDLQPKDQNCLGVFNSYIYLFNDSNEQQIVPSYILSQSDQAFSLIITYIGGLRKYSYCILPNEIVQILLKYLYDREDPSLKTQLYDYFLKSNISLLTRTTIDTILHQKLLPRFKLVCNRSRYILDSDSKIETKPDSDDEDDNDSGDENENDASMTTYNDDYLVSLDYNICTTNNPAYINSLDFTNLDQYDKFPHNRISVSTNDFNVSNFESSLETDIDQECVSNSFNPSYFRQLPYKMQNLISACSNVTLFKSLSFYEFMSSCYYNRINDEYINNHYTNLLTLNLLKSFENVDNFNHQLQHEHKIIKGKTDKLIRRQQSIFNLHSKTKNSSIISVASTPSIFDKSPNPENPYRNYCHSEEEDVFMDTTNRSTDYYTYVNILQRSTLFGNFINNVIKLKNKLNNNEIDPISYYTKPKPYSLKSNYGFLLEESNIDTNYDSINDEEPHFLERNVLENQYELDYDLTLSYLYFALSILATFLSGIGLGILYSFSHLSDDNSRFLFAENLWWVIAVIFGLFISFILSLVSINLSFMRYHQTPIYHSVIIWTGFVIVVNSCIWGGIIIGS